MNRQRQELKAANKQLAEWDTELHQLHDRNGDVGLKVQMLEQELKEVRRWGVDIHPDLKVQGFPNLTI